MTDVLTFLQYFDWRHILLAVVFILVVNVVSDINLLNNSTTGFDMTIITLVIIGFAVFLTILLSIFSITIQWPLAFFILVTSIIGTGVLRIFILAILKIAT